MWLTKNVQYKSSKPISPWRKISLGSWRPTGDSSTHTTLELNIEPVQAFLKEFNENNNCQCNVLQYFSWVMAQTIKKYPYINQSVRFGRLYQRKDVDIFLHVAIDKVKGDNLSGIVIRTSQDLSLLQFSKEVEGKLKILTELDDPEFKVIKSVFNRMPGIFSRTFLNISKFVQYKLNLWSPLFGSPRDVFGSIQISNVGSFGIDNAIVPIAPYTNIPMVVALGSLKKRPFVINDKVEAIKTVKAGFTGDHRLMDGVQFGQMQKEIIRYFNHPSSTCERRD